MQQKQQQNWMTGSKRVNFAPVPGKFISFSQTKIQFHDSASNSQQTNITEIMKYKNALYKEDLIQNIAVYQPCPPSITEVQIQEINSKENQQIINLFEQPLVKCAKNIEENLNQEDSIQQFNCINIEVKEGFASGKRSAIIEKNGRLYRLKGCGNLEQGFPIEAMSYPQDYYEVRGCQYFNSVYRELYFQGKVNEILQKNDLVGGNIPIGVWKYEHGNIYNQLGIINYKEDKIDKYCGIFETLGEKRLQTHLFQGLSLLIQQGIQKNTSDICIDKGQIDGLLNLFKEKNRYNEQKNTLVPTSYLKIFRTFKRDETHLNFISNNETYTKEENSRLIDLLCINDQSILENLEKIISNFLQSIDNECSKYKGEWLNVIASIFARAGSEAGKIKRIFDENLISWGFFSDHNPFEPHCNAHPNNFIVLNPQKSPKKNLLGVIDFDLAYEFSSFINTIEPDPMFFTDQENMQIQQKRFGTQDREQFDDWNNSEKYELEVSLGGEENMSNFSYQTKEKQGGNSDNDFIFNLLNTCLRDTCVLNYRKAYNKQGWLWDSQQDSQTSKIYYNLIEQVSKLVEIALTLTHDEQS